jgi:glycosyltransferase involved in cell wall biosynthesis
MPPSPERALRVALAGHHERHYPRNRAIAGALRSSGSEVVELHSLAPFPWRHLVLAWKYWRVHRAVDIVLVTEGGHRLVPLMRLWASWTGKKLVFDPFLSRYNTRVEDRRLYAPGSLRAWIAWWQDWSSTRAAHGLLFDTFEHREYFRARYGADKPSAVIPVGVDEALFHPSARSGAEPPARPFEVLFYGTYIPLQGIEHILRAAALVHEKDPGIRFRLIGRGQTYPAMRDLSEALGLRNVTFEPLVAPGELPARIAEARVCLGIFGTTLKAGNVVPNKVVQAAAMAAAIVTADTPAVRRYFRDGESALLARPGDPADLAGKILFLRSRPDAAAALGAGSRAVFEGFFSLSATSRTLADFLRGLASPSPRRRF